MRLVNYLASQAILTAAAIIVCILEPSATASTALIVGVGSLANCIGYRRERRANIILKRKKRFYD